MSRDGWRYTAGLCRVGAWWETGFWRRDWPGRSGIVWVQQGAGLLPSWEVRAWGREGCVIRGGVGATVGDCLGLAEVAAAQVGRWLWAWRIVDSARYWWRRARSAARRWW